MADAGTIPLIGGHLALDFANTAGWHASDERSEWLKDFADVVAWGTHSATISAPTAKVLTRSARAHPAAAARALQRTIALREAVYRVFTAIAHRAAPDAEDLALLHAARVKALAAAELRWGTDGSAALHWPVDGNDLASPLHAVMIGVADLLESPDLARLRQCGRDPCGWLFLDRTRNGTRRWCSSAECGNATRVARFRQLNRKNGERREP